MKAHTGQLALIRALAQQRAGADYAAWLQEQHAADPIAYSRTREREARDWMRSQPRPRDVGSHSAEAIDLLAWFATRAADVDWQQSAEAQALVGREGVPVENWARPDLWKPFQDIVAALLQLTIAHEFDQRPPLERTQLAAPRVVEHVLIATHPKSWYDRCRSAQHGIERQVALAKQRGDTIVYLLDGPCAYANRFTVDCTLMPSARPDLVLHSTCGEHKISARGRCTVVGGFFARCLATTLGHLLENHTATGGAWPLLVELPSDAIYCESKRDPDYCGEWYKTPFLESKLLQAARAELDFWIAETLTRMAIGLGPLVASIVQIRQDRTVLHPCDGECRLDIMLTGFIN